MPSHQAIISQTFVATIVAKVVEKAATHFGSFGVTMNVTQSIQCSYDAMLIYLRKETHYSNIVDPKNALYVVTFC